MPRKKVIEIYEFEELDDEAKERAIEWYRSKGWCWDQPEVEMFTDSQKEWLESLGYLVENLNWDTNPTWAMFSADVDIVKWASHLAPEILGRKLDPSKVLVPRGRKEWRPLPKQYTLGEILENPDVGISVQIQTTRAVVDIDYSGEDEEALEYWESFEEPLEDLFTDVAQDVAGKIAEALDAEIEYLCGDEAIVESLEGLEFDREGNVI